MNVQLCLPHPHPPTKTEAESVDCLGKVSNKLLNLHVEGWRGRTYAIRHTPWCLYLSIYLSMYICLSVCVYINMCIEGGKEEGREGEREGEKKQHMT